MFVKSLSTAAIALSIAVVPTTRAQADAGDFVAGALIGGIVGYVITKESQKSRQIKTRSTSTRSTAPKTYKPRIPATQEGRQIQTSLNYFGFDVGAVDGQLGRKSRAGISWISGYQDYMGYPVTGQLTVYEQDLLISSYSRA